jgi:hypothetical protein
MRKPLGGPLGRRGGKWNYNVTMNLRELNVTGSETWLWYYPCRTYGPCYNSLRLSLEACASQIRQCRKTFVQLHNGPAKSVIESGNFRLGRLAIQLDLSCRAARHADDNRLTSTTTRGVVEMYWASDMDMVCDAFCCRSCFIIRMMTDSYIQEHCVLEHKIETSSS